MTFRENVEIGCHVLIIALTMGCALAVAMLPTIALMYALGVCPCSW